MSRESEKVFKEFHKYLAEHGGNVNTNDEVQKLFSEFLDQYNSRDPVFQSDETAESADDYLELAYEAETVKDALKYAKQALKLEPHNFDARSMVIDLGTQDDTKLVWEYAKAVQEATEYMKKEGYFEDEYIGAFWGVLETRPYMRLRGQYVQELLHCGMIGTARNECEELLRLCDNDNLGMRYQLMHIYAFFEEEEQALGLYKKYDNETSTQMLLQLSILYYKKGDAEKARQYLKKVYGSNKDLKRFLRMIQTDNVEDFEGFEVEGAYRPYSIEELVLEFQNNSYLFVGLDMYLEWASQQVKHFK